MASALKGDYRGVLGLVFLLFLSSIHAEPQTKEFTFLTDHEGWVGDFADYPVESETFYKLSWGWANIPHVDVVKTRAKGVFLAGSNHSDDLFMFIKRPIEGLNPDTTYDVQFSVEIMSNAPTGSIGIGGAPGESVFFKAGVSAEEPKKVLEEGFYLLNVDKGHQSKEGKNALVIGNIATRQLDPKAPSYLLKKLTSGERYIRAKTTPEGKLWIFLGTDSGFEGHTLYYITKVSLLFRISQT